MLPRRIWPALVLLLFILASNRARGDLYDIIGMARQGLSEAVLVAYVRSSSDPYDLSACDIQYLNDIGVPADVLTEMLHHPAPVSDVALARKQAPQTRAYETLVTAPPPDETDLSFLYMALSPYGNWVQTAAYGPCWQPHATLINATWAPYRNAGRGLRFITGAGLGCLRCTGCGNPARSGARPG